MYISDKRNYTNLISIIIPIYNAEKFLGNCLENISSQSYRNIEVLLIDDGSKDKSNEICRCFMQQDARFRLIEQANSGVSIARNKGIEEANGDWIMFVDADDYVSIDTISHLAQYIGEKNVQMICAGYNLVDSAGEFIDKVCLNRRFGQYTTLNEIISIIEDNWAPWAKLYRRDLVESIRFDDYLAIAEDLKFNLEIVLRMYGTLIVCDFCDYNYRINPEGAMHKKYSKAFINALLMEAEMYVKLLNRGVQENEIKKLLTNGLILFYHRFSELSKKEMKKNKQDYYISREIIKMNKEYIMRKEIRDLKRKNMIFTIVYFPYIYFFIKAIYRFRSKIKKKGV